jgi:hypothetical protein
MARSILPSRWRGAGEDKARVNRALRRSVRQDLRRALRDELPEKVDLRREDRGGLRQVVWRRRSADKLNHFIRWARARTEHLPVESRLAKMRGVLPEGLIGEHALLHLTWDDHFQPEHEHTRRRYVYRWWGAEACERLARVAPLWAEDFEVRRLVNAHLRSAHAPTVWWVPQNEQPWVRLVAQQEPPRLMADAEAWVAQLRRAAEARWSVWLGKRDPRGPIDRQELVIDGVTFRVEQARRPRYYGRCGGWRGNPARHPEWLMAAAAVAFHYESGWRTAEGLRHVLSDPTLLPKAYRRD